MAQSKKSQFPPEILVYEVDRTKEGEQILGAVANINELTEDMDGQHVAVYTLTAITKLEVKKSLADWSQ